MSILEATRSKVQVCGRSLAGVAFGILPGHGYLSVVNIVCCEVDIAVTGISSFRRSSTECGVSVCVFETSTTRWSKPE
jgi:hypothetical protein